MDEFVQRLLAGPLNAFLSDDEMAILEAYLSIRPSLADYRDISTIGRRNKLLAVRAYNRSVRQHKPEKQHCA